MLVPRRWFVALVCLAAQLTAAQHKHSNPTEVEQHIQRVTTGLLDPVVIKGDERATHTLADRMKELNIPGVSVVVVHDGKIEWARGFGVRSVGGLPVDEATLFQAASISKPLSAMAALHLVQQNKLALDNDVNTYLATWKLPDAPVADRKPVTLRELLTHTGGITVHGFPGYAKTETVPTLIQVLKGEKPANTAAIRIEAPPGDHWQYSGGGYTIMQEVLLDTTKEPYPKLMHDTVLVPIGMTHSTYQQPLPPELEADAATPYRGDGKPVEGGAHTYPEMAAAGLWTTPTDLARYVIEVQRSLQGKANHVLSQAMTQEMVTAGKGKWGLGLEIGGSKDNPYFSHGGANEGYRCIFVAYEKTGDGAVVMTNSDNGGLLGGEVLRSIAAEYGWPDYKAEVRTVVAVDPKIFADYAGTYQLAAGFNLVVTVEDGKLMTQATGQGKIPVYAESETKFFPTVVAAEIEFVKDPQGKVTHLILHQGGRDMNAPKK
ncbi:MAG TPA: serine hydrolase [Terracidiphilus sp.]|nr:serine hydrolase [Terracidiphilus sp.]